SFYAEKVPSLFVFLGGMDPAKSRDEVAGHHTPDFHIDDRGLKLGVEIYSNIALDYLSGKAR
ncbi:MAG: amidohydrolase, partial [Lewinella sp.]